MKPSQPRQLLEDWTSNDKEETGEGADIAGGSGSSEGDAIETNVGASFSVRYMGSSLVDTPNGSVATAEAIKAVIAMSKAGGKKLQKVILSVNLRGIKVIDTATNETKFDVSIYRISYCSADAAFNHVFAFIATNFNETMECHAFLCRKRKLARSATLAIARTFNTAYEFWQLSHGNPPAIEPPNDDPEPTEMKIDLNKDPEEDGPDGKDDKKASGEEKKGIPDDLLIDFNKELELPKKENPWVLFDEDEDGLPKKSSEIVIPAQDGKAVDWGENDGDTDFPNLP